MKPANQSTSSTSCALSAAELAGKAADQLRERFGRRPSWVAAAPGRVNLIGEHTDYNGGFVMPMAVERCTVAAAAPSTLAPGTLRVASSAFPCVVEVRVQEVTAASAQQGPAWSRYVLGVIALARAAGYGFEQAMDVVIESSVPLGSGLSSSAALEVSTATLVEAIVGRAMDPVAKALLCQKAEHEYARVPCGIMDQFISVLARKEHALLLDCRSMQTRYVPLTDASVAVLIANTNVHHDLTDGGYARRRAECAEAAKVLGVPELRDATLAGLEAGRGAMSPYAYRRARHVITENQRTLEAAAALEAGDWGRVGQLMLQSHESLRQDFEVSCSELDLMVKLALELCGQAVWGSRMTGGGFGGCTVTLVQQSQASDLAARMTQAYRSQTGIEPALFVTRPASGAAIVQA